MTIYLALMRDDATSLPDPAEWSGFFAVAAASGLFRGGSALGEATSLRHEGTPAAACGIVGVMRFEADSVAALRDLLAAHPWYRHGGTIELRPQLPD